MAASSVSSVDGGVTTTGRNENVWGSRRVGLYRFTPSTSYPTGGEPFDPRSFGFQGPVGAVFLSVRSVAAAVTRRFEYDHAAKTIKAIVTSTGAEVAAAQDLSTVLIDVWVVGE